MKRKYAGAAVLLCGGLLAGKDALALPAFPGAEGFGADAVGGRGGDVYHVTTLADDPNHVIPGSLFYGLYEKNVPGSGTVPGVGRTIVFDVGGTITLGATALDIKNIKNVTIAGQTAPSPITIIGNTLQITGSTGNITGTSIPRQTSNIILQHINLRKGVGDGEDALSIKGPQNTHNIIVDHVSGSWSEDEVISVTQHATNVTIQNSTLSEALTSNHAFGALIRPDINSNVSYNRNLFSNQKSRNPRPGSYDGMTLNYEFQNNVIYNWSDRAGYIAGADTDLQILNMNYAGNYLIAGPSAVNNAGNPTRRETAFLKENNSSPLELHFFQDGNIIDSNATPARDGTNTGWNMFREVTGSTYGPFPDADKVSTRFAYPASTPDTADIAYAKTIGQVGAFPWARNTTDQRLVNDVINYTGVAPITAPPAGEWSAITGAPVVTRAAGWDTDLDGMPNYWETLRGFNPAVADNNILFPDGYSRLEKYLHFLSAQAVWNLNADGNWSEHMSWRGMRPESTNASASFAAGITAPRTITVDMPATVSQLSFDGTNSYTLAGANTISLSVISGKATIGVTNGNHAISAPLAMSNNTDATVPAGSTLTVSNLQPSSITLTKAGTGILAVNNVRTSNLTVTAGTVKILTNSGATGVSTIPTLSIAASAKLDLNDNKLITNNAVGTQTGGTYNGVQGMVQSANNPGGGGFFDGPSGITTTQADATNGSGLTTIGVSTGALARSLGPTDTDVWAGQTINGNSTLVMYTYAGDANLDGFIDGTDYFYIDSNVGTSAGGYGNGDFNYDGTIDGTDYFFIDSNIGLQGAPFFASGEAELLTGVTAVPEPASMGVLAAIAGVLMGRRRNRQ